ncbi:hypothetical protein [Caulobacter radicis]|uniref:Uncharacterized protein n=1 Tax=Caulobacter radicis TaxID=2172650 RepID=A0A2T9JNB8_9CAUL|nr:hypothetical protein [Caulobacter radicis]PVM85184.1 hypothetical protein DDF65_07740 [Caulobacter radicis]
MSDPVSIYEHAQSIGGLWPPVRNWPFGVPAFSWSETAPLVGVVHTFNVEPGVANVNYSTYALSCENGGQVLDYYLVQLQGELRYPVVPNPDESSLYCDGYRIEIVPHNPAARLREGAPQSSPGQSTVSTSLTTTISGNIGFMGDTPTGGLGGSVSTSHTRSMSLPGVVVEYDGLQDAETAKWTFAVDDQSPVAKHDFSHDESALFSIDRAAGGDGLALEVRITFMVSDHGGGGSRFFDEYASALRRMVGDAFRNTGERSGEITLTPLIIQIPQPAAPKAKTEAA